MSVVIRAFNREGYYKDIVIMNEKQVISCNTAADESLISCMTGLIGVGIGLQISNFPEVVRFEVVIKDSHG